MKKTIQFLSIATLFIGLCSSCESNKNASPMLTKTGDTIHAIMYEPKIPASIHLDTIERENFLGGGRHRTPPAQVFENVELPSTYTDRHFIDVANSYDLNIVVGHIYRFDTAQKIYERMTLNKVIKTGTSPKVIAISDDPIYDHTIDNTASFNGSALIGSFKASADEIVEITVLDAAKCAVDDEAIDSASY